MEKVKIKNYPMQNPMPVILVGAEVHGKPNYATVGAYGVVCLEPIFYISLKSTHHTTLGVKDTGFFSVNIPSRDMVRQTDYCGMTSGRTADKSTLFTPFYDELGRAPMITECSMNFLCKVIKSTSLCGFEIFFGEILASYVNGDCLAEGKVDPLKADPLMIMAAGYFTLGQQVGNIFKDGKALESPRS